MECTFEDSAEGPPTLGVIRQFFLEPHSLAEWMEEFKNADLPTQLTIYERVQEAELWLWAHNGAIECHAFTLFAQELVKQLWSLHQRSVQFRNEMFADDVYGHDWGSW